MRKKTTNDFIIDARKIHGDKYDYSKVEYKNAYTPVCIICPKHGEFWQTPHTHLGKHGCKFCKIDNNVKNITQTAANKFVEQANIVHHGKYLYDKVEYINAHTKIKIICPKHGEFLQTPNKHLNGQGCPICGESSLEKHIRYFLEDNQIEFESQKRFENFKYYPFDFFIPSKNMVVECQGIQHFIDAANFFNNKLEEQLIRDKKKYDFCRKHNIKIVYYTDKNFMKYRNILPIYDENLYCDIDSISKIINS